MTSQEILCRLCLKIGDNSKVLEGNMKDFLDNLLPKTSLTAILEPVICTDCAEVLKKYFDFKAMYFNAHDNIIPSVNNKDALKLDLADVPLGRNKQSTDISENQETCRVCMTPLKNGFTVSLCVERGDVTLEKMIQQCLPELDLSNIKKPAICASCCESLEMCFRFIKNCLIVDEKIKNYCEFFDINSTDQIELRSVLQFTIVHVSGEVDADSADIIKIEKQLCEKTEIVDNKEVDKEHAIFKLEQISYDDSENVKEEVVHKNERCVDIADMKYNNEEQFIPNEMLACREDINNVDVIKIEDTSYEENEIKEEILDEMDDQKFLTIEDIQIKTDESDFYRNEEGVVLPHQEIGTRLHRSDSCSFQTEDKHQLEDHLQEHEIGHNGDFRKHLVKHEDPFEVAIYKCVCCSYQTRCIDDIKKHMVNHNDPSQVTIYKCDSCSYQTRRIGDLKKHLLKHKDPSQVIMHKCDSCSYQTRRINDLKKHFVKHKDPPEFTMYKCDVDEDASEVTMFKCDFCSYQTRRECTLKVHMVIHKDPSEVTMYKCDICLYQTRHERAFKVHMVNHKDPSEVMMYKCDFCSYQTRHKGYLKKHLVNHKGPSEVTLYKCYSCSYKTRHKDCLKYHLLTHKDPSEITMYKCDFCSFQTRYKHTLKGHMMTHKDPSELTMYKCDICSFQTRNKYTLKEHKVTHKDPSEVTRYKCDVCSHQTRRKSDLKRHLMNHMDPSEITMYKCSCCSYQTRHKIDIRKHLVKKHKDRLRSNSAKM